MFEQLQDDQRPHGRSFDREGNHRQGGGALFDDCPQDTIDEGIIEDFAHSLGDWAYLFVALMATGEMDLSLLDAKVEELCTKLLMTFPDCTTKTVEELRKPKLEAWNANKENSRAWLSLNMMTEARMGFRAFNEGSREVGREVDFIKLRQELASGTKWTGEFTDSMMPGANK